MDAFTRQYIETALWSSTDDDDEPLDRNYDASDIHPDSLRRIVDDCERFQSLAGDMILCDPDRAGHDFWLTRNGHGAGFWDGEWPDHGDTLSELSDSFGECDLYAGDDGMLHLA